MADLLTAFNITTEQLTDAFMIGSVAAAMAFSGFGLVFGSAREVFIVTFLAVLTTRFLNANIFRQSKRMEPKLN